MEQRWRCRFEAKCLSDTVSHRMGWNSHEKDKRMKWNVKCTSLQVPLLSIDVCGHVLYTCSILCVIVSPLKWGLGFKSTAAQKNTRWSVHIFLNDLSPNRGKILATRTHWHIWFNRFYIKHFSGIYIVMMLIWTKMDSVALQLRHCCVFS